jgi:mannitol 2-dehydrogenase
VTTDADRAEVRDRFGIDDRWPVVCEPFTQWVLEDDFSSGRPPYEEAGVQLVSDVEPYELMKLRLLNGSHQAMCYFGYLAGYRLVHEAAQDELVQAFLLGYMNLEAAPTLPPVPGVDLAEYKRTLIERFCNPQIRDTLARICGFSSDRIPKWVLPVIRHQLATGGEITRAAAVVASWARYAEGIDEQGTPIDVVDRLSDSLIPAARRQREEPTAFIANRALFGALPDNERFVTAYLTALRALHEGGARATLGTLLEAAPTPRDLREQVDVGEHQGGDDREGQDDLQRQPPLIPQCGPDLLAKRCARRGRLPPPGHVLIATRPDFSVLSHRASLP